MTAAAAAATGPSECHRIVLPPAGSAHIETVTIATVEIGGSGGSPGNRTYVLTLSRLSAAAEASRYYTSAGSGERTAGSAASPGSVTVNYQKWSAAFGHDNLTVAGADSSGAVIVARGNEFGAATGVMLRSFGGSATLVLRGAAAIDDGAVPSPLVTANASSTATLIPTVVNVGVGVTAHIPGAILASIHLTQAGTYAMVASNADAGGLPAFNFTVVAGDAVPSTLRWRLIATRAPHVRVAIEALDVHGNSLAGWRRPQAAFAAVPAANFTAKVCDIASGGAHFGFNMSAWLINHAEAAFTTPVFTVAADHGAAGDPATVLHAAVVSAAAAASVAVSVASSNGGSGKRRLHSDDLPWTSAACFTSLNAAFNAGEHSSGYCAHLASFAGRSCFCQPVSRASWHARKGREWVALAAAGLARCELAAGRAATGAACFPEVAACPAGSTGTDPTVVLDLSAGHYWLNFTLTGSAAMDGGMHVVSATLTGAGAGALTVGGGAVVHVARRPHADATGGQLEAPASPLAAGAVTVTVRLSTRYNNHAHAGGGDAFAILPELISAPAGAADSVAQSESGVAAMTTAYSAYGYGDNAVKYKGWRIVDLGIGHYELTSPHSAPGSYAVNLYLATGGCDYRGDGAIRGGEGSPGEGGCVRSVFKRLTLVVRAAGVSAAGTTGVVRCQPGPPPAAAAAATMAATCWLTAGMPVEVAVEARDRFGNPTLRAGDSAKFSVSVCALADNAAAATAATAPGLGSFRGCLAAADTARATAVNATEIVTYVGATVTEPNARAAPGQYLITLPAPAALGAYVVVVHVDGVRADYAVSRVVLRSTTLSESKSSVISGPDALPTRAVVFVRTLDEHGSPVALVAASLNALVTRAGLDPPGSAASHSFVEVSPGYYRAALTSATAAGNYAVSVVGGGGRTVGVGAVTVHPDAASAAASDLASFATRYSAGASVLFYVFARDAWENRVTSAVQLAATPLRFGVTISRTAGGAGATIKLDAVDVGGGAYLVEFTLSPQPNVGYSVAIAMCPPLTAVIDIATTTTAAITGQAPRGGAPLGAECDGGATLAKSPWTFASSGGTLRSTCYRVLGDHLAAGSPAGVALFQVVFQPSEGCGQQPPGPEPLTVVWTRMSTVSGATLTSRAVYCESPRLDGDECRFRILEPMAGSYQVNATLFGEPLPGTPVMLTVRPTAPARRLDAFPGSTASASRLTGIVNLRAGAPVPAGERLTVEVALVDRYSNPVLPDPRLFFGLEGTLAPATAAATAAAATAAGEVSTAVGIAPEPGASVSVALTHVAGGVYRGLAPGVTRAEGYVLSASVHVLTAAGRFSKLTLEAAVNAMLAVSVTPGTPDPGRFTYRGTGTAPTAVAGSPLTITVLVRDRFGNLITDGRKLALVIGFSKIRVAAADPAVAARDDGQSTHSFRVIAADKGELAASFTVSQARDWVVSVVSNSSQSSSVLNATQTVYVSRALSILAGDVDIAASLVYGVRGGNAAPLAGATASFSVLLRDRLRNGIPAVAALVSFAGSLLVGTASGTLLTFDGGGLTLVPQNESMGVYHTTA